MTFAVTLLGGLFASHADACTGISLTAQDGSQVVARTVEWAATPMQCGYVVAPRGHQHQSYTPTGENGLKYSAAYGYVGIYTECQPVSSSSLNMGNMPHTILQTTPRHSATCSSYLGCFPSSPP